MVLQDLGDAPVDDFAGNADPSDRNDTFSSAMLDTSSFARPLPLPLPFLGFSEQAIRRRSEATIKYAEGRIHRAMTHEEQQLLASHLYQMEQTKSYFAALGVGAGGMRAYKTMDTFRYPFYLPKAEAIKPDKFMFVKGPAAYYARHSWRFALYFLVASQIGNLIGQAVAQPLAAQATAREPQLAQFGRDLKAGIEGDHKNSRKSSDEVEGQGQASRERLEREHQERNNKIRESLGLSRGSRSKPPAESPSPSGKPFSSSEMADDMSPTSADDAWASSSSPTWSDIGLSPESRSDSPSPLPGQVARARRSRYESTAQAPGDDMSPTGGTLQDEVQRQSRSDESAWERLRRGQAPSRPSPRDQRGDSSSSDNFTFAETDEDRKRAQQQAQQEFDARLEQERQGKDFNEERRW